MKKEKKCCEGCNIWRKVAISGAVIFLIIILFTAVKVIQFKSRDSFQKTSEEQKEKALSLIQEVSINEGFSLENYNINIDNKIMGMKVDDQKKHILRATLVNENEIKTYIIDIDNRDIVQSSNVKYYSWMINLQKKFPDNKERWLHNEMLKRGPDGR